MYGRVIGAVFLFVSAMPVLAQDADFNPERWQQHLTEDLLPFWSDPAAVGSPPGAFPGNLCNDGSAPVAGSACAGVSAGRASNPRTYIVSQSRQVFSYGVAFHLTGDRRYLTLAQQGAAYQFETFLNADTGLFHERIELNSGATQPMAGNEFGVRQAYGLIGPSFLYYLTGDADLYRQIQGVEQAIYDNFRDPVTGGYKLSPSASDVGVSIGDHLDHLNAWQVLLASQAPLADRAGLTERALQTARYLRDVYYDETTGVFKERATTLDGDISNTNLGFSAKAAWFIDQTAKLAGDAELEAFAAQAGERLFERAYREDIGAWTTALDGTGAAGDTAVWWQYAEFNQYASSLAVENPELRDEVLAAQTYWLENFVDPEAGGIWDSVNLSTGVANTTAPKHSEWKAGFHSYENALISYLNASAISGQDAELFFARDDGLVPDHLAYGYTVDEILFSEEPVLIASDVISSDVSILPQSVQRATLSGLSFANAAATSVPVPPAGLLLVTALGLVCRGRRRAARID